MNNSTAARFGLLLIAAMILASCTTNRTDTPAAEAAPQPLTQELTCVGTSRYANSTGGLPKYGGKNPTPPRQQFFTEEQVAAALCANKGKIVMTANALDCLSRIRRSSS